jgi:hypothetical protein
MMNLARRDSSQDSTQNKCVPTGNGTALEVLPLGNEGIAPLPVRDPDLKIFSVTFLVALGAGADHSQTSPQRKTWNTFSISAFSMLSAAPVRPLLSNVQARALPVMGLEGAPDARAARALNVKDKDKFGLALAPWPFSVPVHAAEVPVD